MKSLIALFSLSLFLMMPVTFASGSNAKTILFYYNHADTQYNSDIDKKIIHNLEDKFPALGIIDGDQFADRFNKIGISNVLFAEKQDFINAVKYQNIDYIMVVELRPFIIKNKTKLLSTDQKVSGSFLFKFFDVKHEQYLYSGIIDETFLYTNPTPFSRNPERAINLTVDQLLSKLNLIAEQGIMISKTNTF
jgi:hypothetical protein